MTEWPPARRLSSRWTPNILQYNLKKTEDPAQIMGVTGPMLATWDYKPRASAFEIKSSELYCPKLVVRKRLQVYCPATPLLEQPQEATGTEP